MYEELAAQWWGFAHSASMAEELAKGAYVADVKAWRDVLVSELDAAENQHDTDTDHGVTGSPSTDWAKYFFAPNDNPPCWQ